MADKRKKTKKLKITFINPNSNERFEKLLMRAVIEKIKNPSIAMTEHKTVIEGNKQ